MSDEVDDLLETRGVKRDEEGRVRFRTIEANKSGEPGDEDE